MRRAIITGDEDGWHVRLDRYDAETIDAFKAEFSSCERSYDASSRIWSFEEHCLDLLRRVLRVHGWQVEVLRADPAPRPPASPHAELYLLPSAPPSVVEAAFRALVRDLHPDVRGDGDGEPLRRVIEAHRRLTGARA